MTGAVRWILHRPLDMRIVERAYHPLAAMADDDYDACWRQRACCVDHMSEHRLAADPVKNLRQIGAHALAEARRENDDLERQDMVSEQKANIE